MIFKVFLCHTYTDDLAEPNQSWSSLFGHLLLRPKTAILCPHLSSQGYCGMKEILRSKMISCKATGVKHILVMKKEH